jgi:hypothetical protein
MANNAQKYNGVTIDLKISPVRAFEARATGRDSTEMDEVVRESVRASLERVYPGATIQVATEGDQPSATITGADDPRIEQELKYAAQKTALKAKWDIFAATSTG